MIDKPIKQYSIPGKIGLLLANNLVLGSLMGLNGQAGIVFSILYGLSVLAITTIWTSERLLRSVLLCIGAGIVMHTIYQGVVAIVHIPDTHFHFRLLFSGGLIHLLTLLTQYLLLRKLYDWKKIVLNKRNAILLSILLLLISVYFICDYLYGYWWANRTEIKLERFLNTISYDPYGKILGTYSYFVLDMQMIIVSILFYNSNNKLIMKDKARPYVSPEVRRYQRRKKRQEKKDKD